MSAAPVPDWLQIVAVGSPKPKGSLRHVGHGRMVEQLEGSKPWREAVKWAALEAIAERDGRWFPFAGPVSVDVTITVPKPASAPKTRTTWPITRRSGDIDKHLRNVLDALSDAAVFGDDSQVIAATVRKVYPGEHQQALTSPGARIFVCPEEAGA